MNETPERFAPPPAPEILRAMGDALAAPFEECELKYKALVVKGNRAIACFYVDARTVMDRLDAVFGMDGWSDQYQPLPDGSCLCELSVRFPSGWVTKSDVGGQSEQKDEGDRDKSAVSDALKRAAVKLNIGRYLYRLEQQWCDYDPIKKQFTERPRLPKWALPDSPRVTPAKAEARPADPKKSDPRMLTPAKASLPKDGAELLQRLKDADAELHKQGLSNLNALVDHVQKAGVRSGFPADLRQWDEVAIRFAVEEVKRFRSGLVADAKAPPPPPVAPLRVSAEQLAALLELKPLALKTAGNHRGTWEKWLAAYGVNSDDELSAGDAEKLLAELRQRAALIDPETRFEFFELTEKRGVSQEDVQAELERLGINSVSLLTEAQAREWIDRLKAPPFNGRKKSR